MRILLGTLALILVSSCGDQTGFHAQPSCTISGAYFICPDGHSMPVPKDGAPGVAGSTGAAGQTGAQGVAGINGTTVTVVQFCPSYPATSFPEVGFCIGGKLYAEYYAAPSSGLVYLPIGNYISTITGAPCNFTVLNNCEVQ